MPHAIERSRMPRDDGSLLLNGARLADMGWWLTAPPEVGPAEVAASFTSVPGAMGSADLSLTDQAGRALCGRREVALHLQAVGSEADARRAQVSLGALHGAEVSVRWRGLPGEFRGRCSLGSRSEEWALGRFVRVTADLTVEAMPVLFGEAVSVALPRSGALVAPEGNVPVPVSVTGSATGSKTVGASVPGASLSRALASAPTSGVAVSIDSAARTLKVNGALTAPSIDSDWLWLDPSAGPTAVSYQGMRGVKVSYEPRYLI